MGPDSTEAALETLLATYASLVRGVARQKGLDEAAIDEVLQDVRIRLWRALPGERIGLVNSSYVYRTALTAVCDYLRRRRGEPVASVDRLSGYDATRLAEPAQGERALERAELGAALKTALGRLADSRRPVVKMYLAGYSQGEIERVLGWSEAKTRNVLYRGLAELRRTLGELGIHPEPSS